MSEYAVAERAIFIRNAVPCRETSRYRYGHVGNVGLEGPVGNGLEVKGREVQRLAQGFGQSSSKVRLLCSTPESKLDFPAKSSW